MVLVLLSAHIKRFSVSRTEDLIIGLLVLKLRQGHVVHLKLLVLPSDETVISIDAVQWWIVCHQWGYHI